MSKNDTTRISNKELEVRLRMWYSAVVTVFELIAWQLFVNTHRRKAESQTVHVGTIDKTNSD
jgi:hypothetical protein